MSRIVVLAWGNPGRGDDGLAPAFAAAAAGIARQSLHQVTIETDFQLGPEHALDLQRCDAALFVDASVAVPPPFAFTRVNGSRDASFTSHAMTPAAVVAAYGDAFGPAPPAFALAIGGEQFELGSSLTPAARSHLDAALAFFARLVAAASPDAWADFATELDATA